MNRSLRRLHGSVWIAALMALSSARAGTSEQERLPPNAQIGNYVGTDVMIPMRDGVKLHAEVWRPRGDISKLPILMQRSPYGFGLSRVKRSMTAEYNELAQEGFIFVLEDIRGRFGSEGEFVMLRPKAMRKDGVDESTDTYDSISSSPAGGTRRTSMDPSRFMSDRDVTMSGIETSSSSAPGITAAGRGTPATSTAHGLSQPEVSVGHPR